MTPTGPIWSHSEVIAGEEYFSISGRSGIRDGTRKPFIKALRLAPIALESTV